MMNKNEIVLFESKDKKVALSVPMDGNTVWLNQAQMTELFKLGGNNDLTSYRCTKRNYRQQALRL